MRGHDSSLNSHRWGHWGKIYHICHIMEPLSVLLGFKRDPPYLWSSRLWSIQVIGTDDCCWRDSQLQKTSIYLSIVMHLSKFLRRLWTATIPKYVKKRCKLQKTTALFRPLYTNHYPSHCGGKRGRDTEMARYYNCNMKNDFVDKLRHILVFLLVFNFGYVLINEKQIA